MLPDDVIDPSTEMSPAVVFGDKYSWSPVWLPTAAWDIVSVVPDNAVIIVPLGTTLSLSAATGSPTARPVVDDKPVTVRLPFVTFPLTDSANPSDA
jgi:hypothetical protein